MTLPVHSQALKIDLERLATSQELDKVSTVARAIFYELGLEYGPSRYTQSDVNKLVLLLDRKITVFSEKVLLSLIGSAALFYISLKTLDWKYFAALTIQFVTFRANEAEQEHFTRYKKEIEELLVHKPRGTSCAIM